jgi:hypothetical protein
MAGLTAQEALALVIGELDNRAQFELALLLIDQAGATCREQDRVAEVLLDLEGRIDGYGFLVPTQCVCDDGAFCDCEACEASREASMADARRSYQVASPAERNPDKYAQDMADAGRVHLLRPEIR